MPKTKRTDAGKREKAGRRGLSLLGQGATRPARKLESFPNKYPKRRTVITFHCTEFTCLCPITGQPDFGTIDISYIPNRRLLESKSLKLYLWTYRDVGIFHEEVVNELLDALHAFLKPRWMSVTGHFHVRGGIGIDVTAERGRRNP